MPKTGSCNSPRTIYFISTTSSADNDDDNDNDVFLFRAKASAAVEAVLDRDAFLDKPLFSVHDHWTTTKTTTVPDDVTADYMEDEILTVSCDVQLCQNDHEIIF